MRKARHLLRAGPRLNADIGRAVMFLLVLLSWSTIARAQELRAYIGGVVVISPWGPHSVSGGSPSTTYDNVSTDTMVSGVGGEAGWWFGRAGAVGIEIGVPLERKDLTQHFYYLSPYIRETRYREQTIFVVARGQVLAGGRVRLQLVGGGGPVRGTSLDRVANGKIGSSVWGPSADGPLVAHRARRQA